MIKDGKKVFLLGMLILALVLAGCNSDDGVEKLSATAANFEEVFNSIKAKPGNYAITLTSDLLDYPGIGLGTDGVNITVKGDVASRKITWKYVEGKAPLFWVTAGKLTLENISLGRAAGNTKDWPLIGTKGGTIEMKSGVVLSTNINSGAVVESGAFIISGGTIENCGVWLGDGTFTMSGGTIKKGWVNTDGTGVSITITGGIIDNCDVSTGGKGVSITMKGGTITGGDTGIGIWDDSENCVVTISGGIIENCNTGVATNGKGASLTISGGTIKNNKGAGIALWGDSQNCVVTISGGTISGNGDRGVAVEGTGNKLTMSGGTIENCGAGITNNGKGASLTISGGTIRNNTNVGIVIRDKSENCVVTISGGTISENGRRGVDMMGSGNKLTMSGGTISKNKDWGLLLVGANSEFQKAKGAVIYGNSGDNSNVSGAIFVRCEKNDSKSLQLKVDAGKDEVYAAKINAGQTDIVAGSKQGPNW